MWAKAHAEVGISPRTSPRVDCLRFLSPRANRPRKFHTATLSYTFQSVSISRTLNTPDSGVFFSSTHPMSDTVQQTVLSQILLALVGFQGRGFVDGIPPDFGHSLLFEALIFQ